MPVPHRNEKAKFLTVPMVMRELNLCRASTVKLAKESGALLRYGNAQRIDWDRLNNYFTRKYTE